MESLLQPWRAPGVLVTLDWAAMKWARPHLGANRRGPSPKSAVDILEPGDIIRVSIDGAGKPQLA